MQSLNEIRHHIRAIDQTRKITNAMYLVASSRMKRVLSHVDYSRSYFHKVEDTLQDILSTSAGLSHPYLSERADARHTYVVVGGDKGMAGAYNSQLLHFAWEQICGQDNPRVITVGIMASRFFRHKGLLPEMEFFEISQDPSLFNARHITTEILSLYDRDETDRVYVIYTSFHSAAHYTPVLRQLLPLGLDAGAEPDGHKPPPQLLYEPSPKAVFNLLTPQYLIGVLFCALVQAYASEHCARMNAMRSATENADEMLQKLQLQYNLARQGAITREITEIAGAAQALGQMDQVRPTEGS
ncbi:MAG: ATP synthase F1 subunit gamma [Christensenellaceae bacterium]|jgi:F-type H+-transporting ATPase subunit gamma|nr:ATP synthase F1 subunit gamma [Christensenellaceae bacterium]